MNSLKKLLIFSLLILSTTQFFSQTLPRGYKGITLGMPLEGTKQALKERPEFGYHGDKDVSLLPGENRVLIETDASEGYGSKFLDRCYFQFFNNSLYIITINVNQENMDYYSIFTTLTEKYGEPTSFDPEKAQWKNQYTTVSLEKPLTLKYIDNRTFDKTLSQNQVFKAPEEMTRESFLDGL